MVDQDAGHAWAEAYVPDLGWVAFDPANGTCTTDAYVRVAVGLDYLGAAPVRGTRYGGGDEAFAVGSGSTSRCGNRRIDWSFLNCLGLILRSLARWGEASRRIASRRALLPSFGEHASASRRLLRIRSERGALRRRPPARYNRNATSLGRSS